MRYADLSRSARFPSAVPLFPTSRPVDALKLGADSKGQLQPANVRNLGWFFASVPSVKPVPAQADVLANSDERRAVACPARRWSLSLPTLPPLLPRGKRAVEVERHQLDLA